MFLFLWFKLLTAQFNQLNCSFYKANEYFYVKQQNGIIIQNDYPKIDQIGYDLFQKSFVMQNFSSGEIQSILFRNSIKFNEELIYCFCQLLDNFNTQIIICIDGIEIDLTTNQHRKHKNAKITNILLEKQNGNCNQLLSDDRYYIKVYCRNSTSIILNYINLQDSSSFQITNNYLLYEEICLRKFFTFQQEEYLSYYNCTDWRIYQIDKNERKLNLILSQNNFFNHQIKFLADIEICQEQLFFIETNQYHLITKDQNSFKLFQQNSLQNNILKIFIADQCNIELIVTQNYENEQIMFKKDQNEISFQQHTQITQIFFNRKYLFIRRKNQLQFIFSEILQQTFTVIDNPLICMYQNGLLTTQHIIDSFCYQIDNQSNKVIFYRLFQYKNFIKPTKKYVFQINNFQIFSTFSTIQIECYQILQDPNYSHQIIQNLKYNILQTTNYCDSIHQFNFPKNLMDCSQNFKLDLSLKENPFIIDINDDFSFQQICNTFDFKNIDKIIWVSQGKPILLSFVIIDVLFFYDCSQNQIYFQINVKDSEVINLNDVFVIWKQDQNFIQFLQFMNQNNNLIVIPFESQIKNIISCDKYLIIQLSKESIIYSIYTFKQIQLNEELKQYGQPIFYFERSPSIQIVQFDNYLAIKFKNSYLFRIIEFTNKKITKIQDTSSFILIQTIHNEQNLIQTFIFDGFELTLTEQLLIPDSYIYRPLILRSSFYHTVLATINNNQITLTLFYTNYLQRNFEVKKTKKLSFYINNKFLFYFDNQSLLRYKNLLNFQVFLQTTSAQVNAFDIFEVQFRFTFNFNKKIEQFYKSQQLILKNECFQVKPQKNQIQIKLQELNQIFKVNQFFLGPIHRISTDSKKIFIQNPFEDDQIDFLKCQKQTDNFCIYAIDNETEFQELDCILQRKDNGQIIIEFCKKTEKCFKQFFIKSLQKLVCFVNINSTVLELQVLDFSIQQQNLLVNQLFSQKFYDNFYEHNILIVQCDLLFIVINKNFGKAKSYFFHLSNTNLNFDQLKFFNIELAIHVKNIKNYYLIVASEIVDLNKQSSYNFTIVYLENNKFNIFDQFLFDSASFAFQLQEVNQFIVQNHIFIKYLFSCEFIENSLIISLLAQILGYSLQVKIKYDFLTNVQIYNVEKIMRHPNQNVILQTHYYDQKILIMAEDLNQYYLYDLTQDLPMHDHIYKSDTLPKLIQEYNTTHYFLIDSEFSSYSIKQIGYKIIMKNQYSLNEKIQLNFKLQVENEVSQSSIQVIVEQDEQIKTKISSTKQVIYFLTLISFTIVMIVTIIYFKKYKKQNSNKQMVQNDKTSIELY